jgi:RHS repeat-associated protein
VWADYRNQAEGPDVYGQLVRDYAVVIDYRYDPLQRLVGADYSTGVHFGYAYDQVGNRTRLTETTPLSGTIVTTYTYDVADRLTQVARAGVATVYTWSDRGELLSDGVQEYAWDAAGRLVGVSGPGGLEVTYRYDGANDRVAMVVDGVTTTYVVDPFSPVDNVSQVLAEETGGAETRYFYGLDLLAQQQGVTLTYLGYDALSVRLHFDSAGDLVVSYRYAPFGEVQGEGPEGYGFTGERWDGPVGLLYLRARYYAPEVGRFVSRDGAETGTGQSLVLRGYIYARNRPRILVDRNGKWPTEPPGPPSPPTPVLPRKITEFNEANLRDLYSWTGEHIDAIMDYYNGSPACQGGQIPYVGYGCLLASIARGFTVYQTSDPYLGRMVKNFSDVYPWCEDYPSLFPASIEGINPGFMFAIFAKESTFGVTKKHNPWNVTNPFWGRPEPTYGYGSHMWPAKPLGFTLSLEAAMILINGQYYRHGPNISEVIDLYSDGGYGVDLLVRWYNTFIDILAGEDPYGCRR